MLQINPKAVDTIVFFCILFLLPTFAILLGAGLAHIQAKYGKRGGALDWTGKELWCERCGAHYEERHRCRCGIFDGRVP